MPGIKHGISNFSMKCNTDVVVIISYDLKSAEYAVLTKNAEQIMKSNDVNSVMFTFSSTQRMKKFHCLRVFSCCFISILNPFVNFVES